MMKKQIKYIFILVMIFLITGCTNNKVSLKNYKESDIDFDVEKITLSKGFQNIDTQIKTNTTEDGSKLSLSLGIVDCREINIPKITRKGNDINIYIEKVDGKDSFLSVPQISIDLIDSSIDDYEDLNYNIVNTNYEPILIKFNKTDIIKKVTADFNISTINLPLANLYKKGDDILWDIDFYSVINNNSPSKELVNIHALVDARSGKLIESMNDSISERMFDGDLLDYIPGNNLLIKNTYSKNASQYTELYIYNEASKDKVSLFNTNGDIISASFSSDKKNIVFIESLNDYNTLYTISIEDKKPKPVKINYSNIMSPKLAKWNKNNLYILNNINNKGELFLYNTSTKESKSIINTDFNIYDFDIIENKLLLMEANEDVNKNIYYKDKSKDNIEKISTGKKASFLNEDTIILLRNLNNSDENILMKYDIASNNESLISDKSIRNYHIQNNNNIIYSSKDSTFNNYLVKRYNLIEDKSKAIFHMIDDNIFLNENKGYVYLSITPNDNIDEKYIYKVYLDKLKIE